MVGDVGVGGSRELWTRALVRESARVRRLLAAGQWHPGAADIEAAAAVLARLSAPLPARRSVPAPAPLLDRDRRLQRVLRTAVHHLDAGAVSAPVAALLAGVARALVPWHAHPNPPATAPAPAYGATPGPVGGVGVAPTDAGEALLPGLVALLAAVTTTTAACPPGTLPSAPVAVHWYGRYAGRLRCYGRPGPGLRTATTVACAGCGAAQGPWAVSCDWRRITLRCPCGAVTREHGLAFSEVWLLVPEV
ncbi:hypothetical protein ACFWP2_10380 [Kitasatospora sp. NPDC058444]|uniref:hypothetical protein n=1 Tax=Kitasatospora sp. NPDC058444 TaxID=3346504 RepID=UPI0036689F4F